MKKSLLTLGLIASCMFAFTACVEEIVPADATAAAEDIISEGIPYEFEVNLGDGTKTVVESLSKISWAEGDALNVFHAEAGTTNYINDGKFTVKAAGPKGHFAGELAKALEEGKSYDWYIAYPYAEFNTNPKELLCQYNWNVYSPSNGGLENIQTLPLWGNTKNLDAATSPTFNVHQVFAMIELTLNNIDMVNVLEEGSNSIPISGVGIRTNIENLNFNGETQEKYIISGDVQADITGETVSVISTPKDQLPEGASVYYGGAEHGDTFRPQHSSLNVNKVDLKVGESYVAYLPVIPMTLPAGYVIDVRAYCNPDEKNGHDISKKVALKDAITFKAGQVQKINVDLTTKPFITEEEAKQPIMFRFCIVGADELNSTGSTSNDYDRAWSGSRHASKVAEGKYTPEWLVSKYFSTGCYNDFMSIEYKKEGTKFGLYNFDTATDRFGKAFISLDYTEHDDFTGQVNGNARYGLAIANNLSSPDKGAHMLVNANFAKLNAGQTVEFYASYYRSAPEYYKTSTGVLTPGSMSKQWKFDYSLDGGKTWSDAVVTPNAIDAVAEDDPSILVFSTLTDPVNNGKNLCNPEVVSCKINETVENAEFVLRISSVLTSGGWFGLAPYYEVSDEAHLRAYTVKNFSTNGEGKPATSYITSMAYSYEDGKPSKPSEIQNFGELEDITGCAYLLVK